MSIFSMTGFARAEGHSDACSWTWEVKSVNNKGRDVRCRMPSGFEGLEQAARKRTLERFQRGSISLSLNLAWTRAGGGFRINQDILDQIVALIPEVQARAPDATPPRIDGLLALRGVMEIIEEESSDADRQALEEALLTDLDGTLDAVAAMRHDEGAHLADLVTGHVDEIERLHAEAGNLAAALPQAIRDRLAAQVASLLAASPPLPEERLAQEAALLMTKADVREELDRLGAHIAAARALVGKDGPVGRELDFLCQEFNREANTLCSKSADIDLTRVGLALKVVVDQLREQVQNIE